MAVAFDCRVDREAAVDGTGRVSHPLTGRFRPRWLDRQVPLPGFRAHTGTASPGLGAHPRPGHLFAL